MFPYVLALRNRRRVVTAALTFLSTTATVIGQNQVSITLNLNVLLGRANQEVGRYRAEFKNLLARETKTFRLFDNDSSLKKRKVIVSNFLVYELSGGKGEATEFRSVISVNGKPVADGDTRAVRLFEKLAQTESNTKELARIQNESLRFDDEIKMYGLTLFQAIALNEAVRDVMTFEVIGKQILNGTETYILKYEQVRQSPVVNAGTKSTGGGVLDYEFDTNGFATSDPRISGTLWIDTQSYQLVREERKLSVSVAGWQRPLLVTSTDFDFQESAFGIRVPKQIVHREFRLDKNAMGTKRLEIVYDYSEFTRPDVQVKSSQ